MSQIIATRLIVITAYYGRFNDPRFENRAEYLAQTIDSVTSEKSRNIIHLIIDDGSTDDAIALVRKKYPETHSRKYFRRDKSHNEPLSSTNARNYGIRLCLDNCIPGIELQPNDYISFLDSDDLAVDMSERLRFAQAQSLDFCVSDCLLFTNDDTAYKWTCEKGPVSHVRRMFWVDGKMPYPTMTWRLNFLRKLYDYSRTTYNHEGIFDGSIGCGEDVDVAYASLDCLRAQHARFGYLESVTTAYRIHETSLAVIRDQRQRRKEENMVIVRHNQRIGAALLHIHRFLVRPECYVSRIEFLANRRKTPFSKTEYIGRYS